MVHGLGRLNPSPLLHSYQQPVPPIQNVDPNLSEIEDVRVLVEWAETSNRNDLIRAVLWQVGGVVNISILHQLARSRWSGVLSSRKLISYIQIEE